MSLFSKIFGQKKRPYVEAGTDLSTVIIDELGLTDWENLQPNYRDEEIDAIQQSLSFFQKVANAEAKGTAFFHPDIVPELQRTLAAEALRNLADDSSAWSESLPDNWKFWASTYLKSWVSGLDPVTLLKLGYLLIKAEEIDLAKQAFAVVLLFPGYAKTFYGGQFDKDIVNGIVKDASDALRAVG
jgi:hypothetical protein